VQGEGPLGEQGPGDSPQPGATFGQAPGQPPPPGWYSASGGPAPEPAPGAPRGPLPHRSALVGILHNVVFAWIVAGLLAVALIGVSVGLVTGSSTTTAPPGVSQSTIAHHRSAKHRSGSGGASPLAVVGTVDSVGSNTFTVTARSGKSLTVDESPSTVYHSGKAVSSSNIVAVGVKVRVRGKRSGNTVRATRVVVPVGGAGT
jgi:hypothetical protein